ncbi:glutathione S-transferase N-terminal domain-containing protein [Ralstonia sp. 25mfcol4.1]|uniref:glutathione S-transferase N-terminal domain-containing protein n=1 Tax=Ralstonia sp. 25mfcol4.1 TaxID=1761899 RepID=UPI0026753C00|nr:glutathione S-transferase N-terminal domain-containing protein [Ralstonia sp. 25mfcol4.1]
MPGRCWRRDPRIAAHNPLAKVPTLILEDGQALYDSRVICEYLASRGRAPHFFPPQVLPDGLP